MTLPTAKRIRLALGAACLCALGTAATAASPDGAQYLSLRTPQSAVTVRVEDNHFTSPDLQLVRDGDSVRGRAFGRVVFLGLQKDEVGGTVGSSLTRLHISEKDGVTTVRGNFIGALSDFQFGPQGLTGTVGRCAYELKATPEGSYQGSRSCGGPPQRPVVLDIPPALVKQGTPMTLTALALVLADY